MATRRPMTVTEYKNFIRFGCKDPMPADEVQRKVEAGSTLVKVESSFTDPGDDYCAVELDGQQIAYVPGY